MTKSLLKPALFGVSLLVISFTSNAKNMHDSWNNVLSKHVVSINNNHSTEVDYKAIKREHAELQMYLDSLAAVTQTEFEQWSKSKQLAFLINAYNAWTVELIVSNIDDDNKSSQNLESIKDLGSFFSSPWSKDFIPLLGKTRSLDNIEHDLIRGAVDENGNSKYNEPRIHFAVNCASIGCPALREEAYTAIDLERQLEAQTVRFLSDATRNIAHKNKLSVSSIFKWYGDDFEQGFRGANSLQQFFAQYAQALNLTSAQQKLLKEDNMKVKFLDYNWKLNARQ
ncbi:DUF547 domain-containing protein [Psychrosphaera sp. B3R10]|uniref:DUF547 domain-containing protein n=1 Tax=unclassified Psychrosphaera TaxID=2641570 RepID=UPI001C0A3090|nr:MULTISPECIES: DUF547 domain-containing protein [unclassified Psychrosphaera]MBU2883202.1 DUF547 domain-containing protein [Psychrosphaera sp. I2R16]MBU2988658.1 DUF547 domain-containing protein [Psychrosphaera sp. B3R10]